MDIIKATKANTPDIVFLNTFVQKIHHEQYPDIFKPATSNDAIHKFFESILSDEQNCLLMAYKDGLPVGYLWAAFMQRPDNALTYGRKSIYINHIAVHEDFRREHIAKTLFEELQRIAKQKEIRHFALDTWTFNTEAHRFFEKMGFETYNLKMWLK